MLVFALIIAACSDSKHGIKVKGSDTEVNLAVKLAEHFYEQEPDFSVSISGGGSGLGIASLMNGQADIANSSRPLNPEEDSLFKARGIKLHTVVFAEDATAIIVHHDFPLDSLDVPTLAKAMSGELNNWSSIIGTNLPITIYGRQSNSGTHSFVRKKLGVNFSREAKEMNGNAQIMEGVRMDRSGIGYVGAGYILDGGDDGSVKVLRITERVGEPAISPLDKKAITEGRYFFQRPLFQFIPQSSWEKVQPFIAFEQSAVGQELIRSSGYYTVEAK